MKRIRERDETCDVIKPDGWCATHSDGDGAVFCITDLSDLLREEDPA